jgi:glycosyltransferase involved in cell wall biosynthesis
MIWLASFPRSGNTFFRNVLYEVYGIESSTYHHEEGYFLDPEYAAFPVVKTHLLPHQLIPQDPSIPKVYIIRDGRDALVSLAHHRKDIVEPGTDFEVNLLEAILAADGSYFGGWSENVRQWTAVADVVIRYEDLIADPVRELEKLRTIMPLPAPDRSRIPTFESLKFGNPRYGSGAHLPKGNESPADLAKKNFRKGRKGSWQEEMPPHYLSLFYDLHGETLHAWGYEKDIPLRKRPAVRVLLEGAKAMDRQMDGVRRYTEELMAAMHHLAEWVPGRWSLDVLVGKDIVSLHHFMAGMAERHRTEGKSIQLGETGDMLQYENRLMRWKKTAKSHFPGWFYGTVREIYLVLPFRYVLRQYRSVKVYQTIRKHVGSVQEAYDLIHVPLPQNYRYVDRYKTRFVFTLHDMTHRTHPQFHVPSNVQLAEKGLAFMKKKRAGVIAVSEHTMNDWRATASDERGPARVVYEAANHHFFQKSADRDLVFEKYGLGDRPYFMCLFTLEPRKNITGTVQAFLQFCDRLPASDFQLIICGGKGWKDDFLESVRERHPDRVRFLGYVPDEDLPALLNGAHAFCYLPHYEGFGLPALEAIQYGTPVLYSNTSSLPEVCGDAGLPADPGSMDDMASKMLIMATDSNRYLQMKQATFMQSRKFSWVKAAFETLLFYEEMASS